MTPSPDPMNSWRTALLFGGNSYVALTKPLPAISAGVTIEFWAFGADDLPRAASLFASGKDHDSRVLNIHLPWSDSCIYWDAGSEGKEFDRIQKTAQPGEYKGSWTHWAFVKDAAKGEMTIYRGNALWHREAGSPVPSPTVRRPISVLMWGVLFSGAAVSPSSESGTRPGPRRRSARTRPDA